MNLRAASFYSSSSLSAGELKSHNRHHSDFLKVRTHFLWNNSRLKFSFIDSNEPHHIDVSHARFTFSFLAIFTNHVFEDQSNPKSSKRWAVNLCRCIGEKVAFVFLFICDLRKWCGMRATAVVQFTLPANGANTDPGKKMCSSCHSRSSRCSSCH